MSYDLNAVQIIGRLTADPELKHTQANKPICNFNIANNQGKDEANFLRITAWEKTAQNVCTYCKKGSRVAIVGRLKQSKYQDKNGEARTSIEIIASTVQFLDSAPEKKAGENGPRPAAQNEPIDFEPLGDDEVPF